MWTHQSVLEADIDAQVVEYHSQEEMIPGPSATGHVSDEVDSTDDPAESSSLLQSLPHLLHCSIQHHHILDCSHHDQTFPSSRKEMSDHDESNLECDDVGWSSEADMANYEADSEDSEAAIDSEDSEADNVEEGIETRDVHDLETEATCDISTTHGLYEGPLISTKATLALLTQLAQRYRLSKSALSDFMKVISVLLPQQPDVLKSGFHFNKALS